MRRQCWRTPDVSRRDCENLGPDLVAFADGELSGPEREAVEAHLAECPECRAALEAHRAVARLVAEYRDPALSPDLETRVIAAAEGDRLTAGRARRRSAALAALAAAAAIVIAVSVWVSRPAVVAPGADSDPDPRMLAAWQVTESLDTLEKLDAVLAMSELERLGLIDSPKDLVADGQNDGGGDGA